MESNQQTRTIKTPVLTRHYEIRREAVNVDQRTVELTFSSEEPYGRFFGNEILDHDKKSVLLDRLKNGGPLLLDHDPKDLVGVVEQAKIGTDRRGWATVRLGKSARSEEVLRDIADGIRKNVSVGYRVHQMVLEKSEKTDQGELSTYRVTRWEPLEVSVVAVPADPTVGVNRAEKIGKKLFDTEIIENKETLQAEPVEEKLGEKKMADPIVEKVVDLAVERDKVRKEEQKRVREILAYGEQFKCVEEARKAVDEGTALDDFRVSVLERLGKVKPVETAGDIGMTQKEIKEYRILDGVRALCDPRNAELQKRAGLVFEASRAFADKVGKQPRSFFIPPDVLFSRDVTGLTDAAGGYLVGTQHMPQSFIDLLRNRMVLNAAGATMLTGLQGDIAIPKQTGGATAYWVAENSALTESAQTFGQLALQPKTAGAYTDVSRKLMLQSSPSVEMLVRSDLQKVIAIEIDRVGFHGTGVAPQPAGVAVTSGIGSVVGGTNGATITYAHCIKLETEVAIDNADVGALAYITNSKVRGKLKQIFTNATYGSIPVWQDGAAPGVGRLNGYPAYVTNQVSYALTKGSSTSVCSGVFFGNWSDLVIGMWSGLDVLVDPYTGSTAGTVRIVVMQDLDMGVRHAESFAYMADALTT